MTELFCLTLYAMKYIIVWDPSIAVSFLLKKNEEDTPIPQYMYFHPSQMIELSLNKVSFL